MKKVLLMMCLMLSVGATAYVGFGEMVKDESCAKCVGAKNCNACKNCKYCKHCNEGKGSCGVCK
ncbi:hypothetical protein [Capnocytophaga canimorsus]|uniref:Uncharacterized protein n=1 Tax=Capnocytophaga canimorsus TaxID=28188 RepID=A0A250G814_9FLAO|nr:hypothetical protein [Capnocytophaga canimorsus]ATA92478.1 hypothetical protein CGC56_10095 [Capnocytophaga canimorsus]GIM59899.1 hypothetical protein CAPN007_21080 [Capnocytophaga canimorsus]